MSPPHSAPWAAPTERSVRTIRTDPGGDPGFPADRDHPTSRHSPGRGHPAGRRSSADPGVRDSRGHPADPGFPADPGHRAGAVVRPIAASRTVATTRRDHPPRLRGSGHPVRSSWRRRRARLDADRGAVSVEAALALCSLVLVLALAVAAVAAVAASVRCLDASRELVRLAARGEPERGRAIATELAPTGARLELTHRGDTVTAEVSVQLLRPLPIRVGGHAVAALEPGAGGP